jgi:alkanesulfonate monooxygenase SsuD/methylene tetrahydromethanopterin reductase-like flavin-dependent oxidoreductase (luciferase family)
MRFGVFFPQQLPRPWNSDSERNLFRNSLDQAELADRIGISYLWAQEHHFLEEYSHSSAPEVFLAACSQRTQQIRIGHGITLMPPNYNHPARVAERIATLDLVSGGRVEWGSGESSSRLELEGFGINYVDKRAMWLEALRESARMLALDTYPGYNGQFLSMPPRSIVPKPLQRPHPPMWVACSNRETLRLAASLGIGALTFAFVSPDEARYWVDEYQEVFRTNCRPVGRTVNPRVAVLSGFYCHPDGARARAVGEPALRFFAYGLSHYFRTGTHVPGRTDVWAEFERSPQAPIAGMGGIGTPDEVREHFRALERAGVDQVILLQQAGTIPHEQICESLELFGREVLPEFADRHERQEEQRERELEPHVARALANLDALPEPTGHGPIDSYARVLEKQVAPASSGVSVDRGLGATAIWRLQVGGARRDDHPNDPGSSNP